MASSSTSSGPKRFTYDAFLSFRGTDIRKTFIDHLYHALKQNSIYTYKDDEKIEKGNMINNELIGSIEDSRFYIIVFSKNYVSSSWCLIELLKILMECHKTTEHILYPIFYDVEPSEVRNQTGAVGEAFARHEKKEGAGEWRKALKEAADVAGWELKNTDDGHEARFIRQFVEVISLKLHSIKVYIDKNIVGMEKRINNVVSSLGTISDAVRMIGIWGIGGGGKTTLARAVFDQISFQFEGKSFVENVREVSNNPSSGLKSIQSQILSNVLGKHDIDVGSVSDGKNKMSWMMRGRKTLLVLDDVDNQDQLEALAGDPSWFKQGSIIIITTRDEQVLVAHGVKLIHNVNLLSDEEAVWLFSNYAFRKETPLQGYEELLRQLVCYAVGLPLTIKVLGSYLCGKSKVEWVDAIAKLKTIPLEKIQKKLELSYIDLDDEQKEIFLDVATILKNYSHFLVIRALESCGFHAISGLRALKQKALITFYGKDGLQQVGMHDQLQEMARDILRRSHRGMPNRYSRLWDEEEIANIMANDLGTEATKGIKFWRPAIDVEHFMNGLRNMKEVRLLDVLSQDYYTHSLINKFSPHFPTTLQFLCRNRELDEVDTYLPESLQYLNWHRYPFHYLPKTFKATNLVVLLTYQSNMEQLWEGGERKVLEKLRFLYISESVNFRAFDLTATPNLEDLKLIRRDGKLVDLYMPVECPKLRCVYLEGVKLRMFDLGLTPNLEELILEDSDLLELHMPLKCISLTSLLLRKSELRTLDVGLTPNLEELYVIGCNNLEELHIADECVKLSYLELEGLKLRTLDVGTRPNLKRLDLQECNDLEEFYIAECPILTDIHIDGSKLRTLDLRLVPSLNKLVCNGLVELHLPCTCLNLEKLSLSDSKLRTLEIGLAPILTYLHIVNCYDLEELHLENQCQKLVDLYISHSKLRTIDLGLMPNLEELYLTECYNLVELHVPIGCLKNLAVLCFIDCLGFSALLFKKDCDCTRDESLEVGPKVPGHLGFTLKSCPFHPNNDLPRFEFECFRKEDLPSLTRSIEKLISEGPCPCTKLESISRSISGQWRPMQLERWGYCIPKNLIYFLCSIALYFFLSSLYHNWN